MSEQEKNQHHYRNSSQKRHTFPWIKTIIVAIIAGIIGALLVLGIGKLLNKNGFTMKVLLFIKFQIVMVAIS